MPVRCVRGGRGYWLYYVRVDDIGLLERGDDVIVPILPRLAHEERAIGSVLRAPSRSASLLYEFAHPGPMARPTLRRFLPSPRWYKVMI
jgi:hypothetical protein